MCIPEKFIPVLFPLATPSPSDFFSMETKTITGIAGTKRRRPGETAYTRMFGNRNSLSKRLNRLTRLNKMQNPPHVIETNLVASFSPASSTSTIIDMFGAIIEGFILCVTYFI